MNLTSLPRPGAPKPVPCQCPAYKFPHRVYSGHCGETYHRSQYVAHTANLRVRGFGVRS